METDYFRCDKCHKQIPTTNRTMHDLRCDRSTHHVKDKDDSDRDTPSAPPSDTRSSLISSEWSLDCSDADIIDHPYGTTTWMCGVCTFENSPSSSHCQMCSNEQSHQQQLQDNVISSSASDPMWACSQCTFSNSLSAVTCEMCDGARPPLESVVDQLIPSSSEDDYEDTASLIDEPLSLFTPSLTTSVVLGAGMGAGWAWLHDRDVRSGMLGGAGLGAVTGLLLDEMGRQEHEANIRMRHMRAAAAQVSGERVMHLDGSSDMMMQHLAQMMSGLNGLEPWPDFNSMTYEELLQRFPAPVQQVGEDVISSLPVRVFSGPGATSDSPDRGDSQACSVCLEDYSAGSSVKTLPCLHCFHADCIDRWLRLNTSCPVCKHSLS